MMIGKSSSFDTEILELGEWRSVNTLANIHTSRRWNNPDVCLDPAFYILL